MHFTLFPLRSLTLLSSNIADLALVFINAKRCFLLCFLTASCHLTSHMALHVFLQCAICSSSRYRVSDQQQFVSLLSCQVQLTPMCSAWQVQCQLVLLPVYVYHSNASACMCLDKLPASMQAIVSRQTARCWRGCMLTNAPLFLLRLCLTLAQQCLHMLTQQWQHWWQW